MSVDLPPAQGSCQGPVWVNLASAWNHGPWRILAVSVGLPPEPGFALELASGHPVQEFIDTDGTGRRDLDRNGDRKACISLR